MPSIEGQPFPSSPTEVLPSSDFSWWGLIVTLAVFLLILLVALWVIRRLNRGSFRGMDIPWARVLDRQVLGGQQVLYLVEVAGKLQVLAGTDHHLSKISEIDDPEVAAEILEEIANRPSERVQGASNFIGRVFGRKRSQGDRFAAELEHLLEEVEK